MKSKINKKVYKQSTLAKKERQVQSHVKWILQKKKKTTTTKL